MPSHRPARIRVGPGAGLGAARAAGRIEPAAPGAVAEPVGAAARLAGVVALGEGILTGRDGGAEAPRSGESAGPADSRAGNVAADALLAGAGRALAVRGAVDAVHALAARRSVAHVGAVAIGARRAGGATLAVRAAEVRFARLLRPGGRRCRRRRSVRGASTWRPSSSAGGTPCPRRRAGRPPCRRRRRPCRRWRRRRRRTGPVDPGRPGRRCRCRRCPAPRTTGRCPCRRCRSRSPARKRPELHSVGVAAGAPDRLLAAASVDAAARRHAVRVVGADGRGTCRRCRSRTARTIAPAWRRRCRFRRTRNADVSRSIPRMPVPAQTAARWVPAGRPRRRRTCRRCRSSRRRGRRRSSRGSGSRRRPGETAAHAAGRRAARARLPWQALPQQTPSAQKPLAHSLPSAHGVPSGCPGPPPVASSPAPPPPSTATSDAASPWAMGVSPGAASAPPSALCWAAAPHEAATNAIPRPMSARRGVDIVVIVGLARKPRPPSNRFGARRSHLRHRTCRPRQSWAPPRGYAVYVASWQRATRPARRRRAPRRARGGRGRRSPRRGGRCRTPCARECARRAPETPARPPG